MTSKTIVLVTGGNAGIGYEIVKKIAVDHADSHHILMGTRSLDKGKAALETLGSPSHVMPVQLDITSDNSIDACIEHIQSTHGRLDILINNAGTASLDLASTASLRERYTHVYDVNVISTGVLTDKLSPLLEASSLPKVIFISSRLGSIERTLHAEEFIPAPFYNSSKAAVNYLAAFYARKYPGWKVNSCCPGYRATGLNSAVLSEETDPKLGAVNACRLVLEGQGGVSGTYSQAEGPLPW